MTSLVPEDLNREPEAMKVVLQALAPLDDEERVRVITFVASKLKIPVGLVGGMPGRGVTTIPVNIAHPSGVSGIDPGLTPKAFLAQKKPDNAVERVACLAFFLTHNRGTTKFKNEDLVALNDEAAQARIGNIAQTVKNAIVQSGYIAADGEGLRQVTARGEAVVNALPNRDAVKAAQAEFPGGRRRAARKSGEKGE